MKRVLFRSKAVLNGVSLCLISLLASGAAYADHIHHEALPSVPASDSAGAVLSRTQFQTRLTRQQPFLTRPISDKDLTVPDTPIRIEEGVLPPSQTGIQGVLVTPGGNVYIGAPNP